MEDKPISTLLLLSDKHYTIPMLMESINTDGTMLILTEILMEVISLETTISKRNSHLPIALELMI